MGKDQLHLNFHILARQYFTLRLDFSRSKILHLTAQRRVITSSTPREKRTSDLPRGKKTVRARWRTVTTHGKDEVLSRPVGRGTVLYGTARWYYMLFTESFLCNLVSWLNCEPIGTKIKIDNSFSSLVGPILARSRGPFYFQQRFSQRYNKFNCCSVQILSRNVCFNILEH